MVVGGLGVATVIHFCVDIFMQGSKSHTPLKTAVVAREKPDQSEATPAVLSKRHAPQAVAEVAEEPAPAEQDQPAAEHPTSDQTAELRTTLEAEYSMDARPTRKSVEREKAIGGLFAMEELRGKGDLQELKCQEKVCRGVVRIANEDLDNEVFGRTFLSPEFAASVRDAVSVASREKQADGSILATFYIHPQSTFEMLPGAAPGEIPPEAVQ